jgi:hypothetical protein
MPSVQREHINIRIHEVVLMGFRHTGREVGAMLPAVRAEVEGKCLSYETPSWNNMRLWRCMSASTRRTLDPADASKGANGATRAFFTSQPGT